MDFRKIISELMGAGLTQCEIAERAQTSQTTVSELLCCAGKQPRYALGATLIALHHLEVVCKQPTIRS